MSGTINDAKAAWANFASSRLSGAIPTNHRQSVQKLDAELMAIEHVFRQAKEMRNRAMPVNILPAELLLEIFFYVRDGPVHNILLWLRVCTHVCRRFRSIALSSHKLWARLDNFHFHPTALTKELVSRSGACPLHIGLFIEDTMTEPEALQFALDFEFHRVETLKFNLPEDSYQGQLFSWLLGAPMPLLKCLHIHSGPDEEILLAPTDNVLQALESLYLHNTAFVWSSAIYDNLIELHLEGFGDTESDPRSNDLQKLFLRMNRVTTLTLKNVMTFDPDSTTPIELPRTLKHFSILDTLELDMDSVAFSPHSGLLEVTLEGHRDAAYSIIDVDAIFDVFQHWSCMWDSQAQTFMELSLLPDELLPKVNLFKVTVYRDAPASDGNSFCGATESPKLTYSRHLVRPLDIDQCLWMVFPCVSSLRLAACGYNNQGNTDSTLWLPMFAELDGLQTLALTENALPIVLPYLARGASTYLPRLRVFKIVPDSKEEANYATSLDRLDHVVWLSQWLEGRRLAGLSGPHKLELPPILRDGLKQVLNTPESQHVEIL